MSSGSESDRVRRVLGDLARHEASRGRFEIGDVLGEGATAVVRRARDLVLGRDVALKVLKTSVLTEVSRERFRREARASAGLAHPNLVAVYDAGEDEDPPYLVMELVEGRSLAELLKTPPADPRELLVLLEKAARGVAAAHARGIVHRDLKPANILVTAAGEPKVGDFGLAHLVETKTELTLTGTTLGTPLYMAPEQVEGRAQAVSPRTDVYALGAILYEMLAGRPPIVAESLAALYAAIVHEDPAPLPGGAGAVALKALEKDPARRYADAGAFADDLRRHLDGEPVEARPPGPLGRAGRRLRRHARVAALGAAALAAALLALGLWVRGDRLRRAMDRIAEEEARPWQAVFDGTSMDCFMASASPTWRLEDGALVNTSPTPEAMQTKRVFGDGELRVRFECRGLNYLGINARLGTRELVAAEWDRGATERMEGTPRELVYTCRGESVTAELDGVPLSLRRVGNPRQGTLHFSGVGGRLRLLSIDFRSLP